MRLIKWLIVAVVLLSMNSVHADSVELTLTATDNIYPQIFTNLSNTTYDYYNFTIEHNATDEGGNLDSLWYNNGTDNSTPQNSNYTFTINYTSDGQKNITFYANDTLGNLNETQIVFTIVPDTTNPLISFVSPTPNNGQALSSGTTSITINVSITEINNDTLILNWMGVNTSYSSTTPYWTITKTVSDGNEYYFYAWINDTAGNSNQTSTITFSVNTPSSPSGTGGGGIGKVGIPSVWKPIFKEIEILDNRPKILGIGAVIDNTGDLKGTDAIIRYTLSTQGELLDQGEKPFRILPKKTTSYIIYPETNYLGEVDIFIELIKDNKTIIEANKLFKTTGEMERGDFFTIPDSIKDRIIILDKTEKIYIIEANKKVRQCLVDSEFFTCLIVENNKVFVNFIYSTDKWNEQINGGVILESIEHERILVPISITVLNPNGEIELENPIVGLPENDVTGILLNQKDGKTTGVKIIPLTVGSSGMGLFVAFMLLKRRSP